MKFLTSSLLVSLGLYTTTLAGSSTIVAAASSTTTTVTGKLRGMSDNAGTIKLVHNGTLTVDDIVKNQHDGHDILGHHGIARSLQPRDITEILPSPSTFFGGNGGKLFDHGGALSAGKIRKITMYAGSKVDGIEVSYEDGRTFRAGKRGGTKRVLNLAEDENIVRVRGRANKVVDRLEFVTNKNKKLVGGGSGGKAFDTGVFKNQAVLQHLRGKQGNVIDAIGFVLVEVPQEPEPEPPTPTPSQQPDPQPTPAPEPLALEVSTRDGPAFGGNGGDIFSDFDTFFTDTILKIQSITVYSGSRVDGLEVEYLTENGLQKVLHGQANGNPNLVSFDDAALKDIFLQTGSRVDQITFVDTKGRSFGPFGGNGGSPNSLRSKKGEVILSLFGRENNEIDQLGAVFATGAIDRVEVSGPFVFTPITEDVSTLVFPDNGSVLVLENCDPDSTTDVTGTISFLTSVTTTETFTQSSTTQTSFEVGVSTTTSLFGQETEISVTVGQSFEQSTEFGQEISDQQDFGFDTTVVAPPGSILTASAVYSELEFEFAFTVPVNIFFAADPDIAVPDFFEGFLDGVAANNGRITLETDDCP